MAVTLLSLPIVLGDYFRSETGAEFGVGLSKKTWLLMKMVRNNRRIPTASHFLEHLMMATQILSRDLLHLSLAAVAERMLFVYP